jgi:hypothetical protein
MIYGHAMKQNKKLVKIAPTALKVMYCSRLLNDINVSLSK